jgi:Flp pilus assembly pilin Flp
MNRILRVRVRLSRLTNGSHRSQAGQGLVEYAMIFLCMALVLIVVVGVIGHTLHDSYSNVSNQFPQ